MSEDLKNHVRFIADSITDETALNGGTENEPVTVFDYLQDALEIEYIVSSKKEYLGARVLVAFGGPNIWINTRTKTVDGYWWSDSATASFQDNIGLDEALEGLFSC